MKAVRVLSENTAQADTGTIYGKGDGARDMDLFGVAIRLQRLCDLVSGVTQAENRAVTGAGAGRDEDECRAWFQGRGRRTHVTHIPSNKLIKCVK